MDNVSSKLYPSVWYALVYTTQSTLIRGLKCVDIEAFSLLLNHDIDGSLMAFL